MYITRTFNKDNLEEDYSKTVELATKEARGQILSGWGGEDGIAIYELKEVIRAKQPEMPITVLTVDDVKLLIQEEEDELIDIEDIEITEVD